MYFVLTIDTEPDDLWRDPRATSVANLHAIPRFQALCERFGFKPTYLCTYDVAVSTAFSDLLASLHARGVAEIGAHLHPWTTPPFDSTWDGPGRASPYPSELPTSLFVDKLASLTAALASALGAPPRGYRAGRWGFAASHIAPLVEHGYSVDCSVTPLLAWRDPGLRGHGPDFTRAPLAPYFMAWDDPARPGSSPLLEVPVTIVYTNGAMRRSQRLRALYYRRRKTVLARTLNRIFQLSPQWFRPFADMDVSRLRAVYRAARQTGTPVVQMMFHSSELMPGASPHNPTADDVERLYRKLEGIFEYLAREGVEGVTLSQFAERYKNERHERTTR